MSVKTASPLTQSPFVGARPFKQSDAEFFFGRASEANEIAALLAKYRLLIVTGEAKTGKTSFLNTTIVPRLERMGCEVLPSVTFATSITAPPNAAHNVFTAQALRTWRKNRSRDLTLDAYLQNRPQKQTQSGQPIPRALVFDQVERLFDSAPHRWLDREWFIDGLINALAAESTLRIVIVIDDRRALQFRDRLQLDDRITPSVLSLWTLGGLYEARSLSAIIEPFQHAEPSRNFAPDSVEPLAAKLRERRFVLPSGETVVYSAETVDLERLQVVCRLLWETLPADVTEIECDHWQPILNAVPPLIQSFAAPTPSEARLVDENLHLREKLERMQRKLHQKRHEIEAAELLKAMIVSTVAHEFNTPLLQIKTSIHLLAEDANRDRDTLLRLASDATARLGTQVQNLTQLAETLDIQPQPMMVRDAVEQALASLRRLGVAKDKLDRVRAHYAEQLPLVEADRKGIGIVLHHLIDNALKFSHDPVDVSANPVENGVLVAVTDAGIGIEREYHKRIFDLFFQVDSSPTKKYGGMGVGLAIVRLILDNHKVDIAVDSEPGNGSTFAFLLPFATDF